MYLITRTRARTRANSLALARWGVPGARVRIHDLEILHCTPRTPYRTTISPHQVTDSGAKQVKVATGLDVPIKILVPLFFSTGDSTQFTLIGLGDIVLPGLLLCFAMRFDDSKVLLPELMIFPKIDPKQACAYIRQPVSEGQSLFAPQCRAVSSPPPFSPASFSSLTCRPPIPQPPFDISRPLSIKSRSTSSS